jgi:hypothetical protein
MNRIVEASSSTDIKELEGTILTAKDGSIVTIFLASR